MLFDNRGNDFCHRVDEIDSYKTKNVAPAHHSQWYIAFNFVYNTISWEEDQLHAVLASSKGQDEPKKNGDNIVRERMEI